MSVIITLSNSYKHGVPVDALRGFQLQKKGPKIAKNARIWLFYLVFPYSTVPTSLLMFQNVRYHHTEQLLQTWSPHRCLMGLTITTSRQEAPCPALYSFWVEIGL